MTIKMRIAIDWLIQIVIQMNDPCQVHISMTLIIILEREQMMILKTIQILNNLQVNINKVQKQSLMYLKT